MDGMDLADRVKELARRIAKRRGELATEEATKHALVMPWITHILGYNVFEPDEVIPEYTADVGTKKGEKVDYAIMADGRPVILIECKQETADLDKQGANQLYRYFGATEAEVAILTNGVEYRIFSDIDDANRMDARPFLVIDMSEPEGVDIEALRAFTKTNYDGCEIKERAKDLLYTREARKAIEAEWAEPNEEFVKYIAKQFHAGVKTKNVMERMTRAVKRAQQEFLTERINRRLKLALNDDREPEPAPRKAEEDSSVDPKPKTASTRRVAYTLNGAEKTAANGSTAICDILTEVETLHPGTMAALAPKLETARYRILADSAEALTKTELQWPVKAAKKLGDHPWFAMTSLTNEAKAAVLQKLCETAGIEWDDPAGLQVRFPNAETGAETGAEA